MIRVAIYARFSSDLQNDKSVDDQIAFCRNICAREGMTVVAPFSDHGISAWSAVNRPGFKAMMRAAASRQFDAIVAEDLDRIFRDEADYHAARKDLDYLGIGIHTATGRVSRIEGTLRALMGAMYLENLALHVRRGLEGVVRSGRHAGGRAYGYATVNGKPGELVIDQAQAAIVRRIFSEFIAGRTPRAIAAALNTEGVAPPRGKRWNASTINGNAARGHGMLLNELYAGRIVWNKVRMVKDPATGKRVSRPNTRSEYRISEVPALRIVDQSAWLAAQSVKQARSHQGAAHARRPPRPLSGLLRCGSCGGGMASLGVANGRARLQCSTYRESGACSNSRKISRNAVEDAVFAGLRDELMQPAAIAEYVKVYNAERRRLAKGNGERVTKLARRDAEIGRELDRLVDAIAKGRGDVDSLLTRIDGLEKERRDTKAALATAGTATEIITLHPASIERYAADVNRLADLAAEKSDFAESDELITILRRLVDAVVIHAAPGTGDFSVEVKGRLAELTGSDAFPSRSKGGVNGGSERGTRTPDPRIMIPVL